MKPSGKVWRLSELGVNVVLLGVISDVHLDQYFPPQVLPELLRRLKHFGTEAKQLEAAGVLVIAGDFIDALTLNGTHPRDVPVIRDVMKRLRTLQSEGITLVWLEGNHDRWLFDRGDLASWCREILRPDYYYLADWLFLEDEGLRMLFDHGHRWDITNREISDEQGQPIKSLGDLVVERLVVPLRAECPDINRVEPLYHIPLYLQQCDPSGGLLRRWLDEFGQLMESPEFQLWRKRALPLATRILGAMLPLFYDVYRSAAGGGTKEIMAAMKQISAFDRGSGDYLQRRQQELLAGKLEKKNFPPEWSTFVKSVRFIINGHTHRHDQEVEVWRDKRRRGRTSTGAWVQRLQLFPETVPLQSLRHFDLTWTQFQISLAEQRVVEATQKTTATVVL